MTCITFRDSLPICVVNRWNLTRDLFLSKLDGVVHNHIGMVNHLLDTNKPRQELIMGLV